MGKIHEVVKLLRIRQWYKGIVVFAGLFFGGKIFDFSVYPQVILAFLLVCLTSSINYVINDLMDIERDRHHPEKCKRPLASGAISKTQGIIILIALFAIVALCTVFVMQLLVSKTLALRFSFMILAIFLTGFFYNIYLKNQAFVDIIVLSTIYLWRTIAGCFILNVEFSPWLYLVIFQVAMFLSISKRKADKDFCGEDAIKHKPIYDKYTDDLIKSIQSLITVSLFITYMLYCVLAPITGVSGPELTNNRGFILFTIPFMMYIIIRFLYLASSKPEIARNPEKAFKDYPLVIAGISLAILIFFGNYIEVTWFI